MFLNLSFYFTCLKFSYSLFGYIINKNIQYIKKDMLQEYFDYLYHVFLKNLII